MGLLLDTHTLIWALEEPSLLSRPVVSILAEPKHHSFVSAATSWELAIKHRLGKLPKVGGLLQDFEEKLEQSGFAMLPIGSQQARLREALKPATRTPSTAS